MHSSTLAVVTVASLFAISVKAWANTDDHCTLFEKFDIKSALDTALNISIQDSCEHINQCLCVNGICKFIETDAAAKAAVELSGKNRTVEAITTIINNSKRHQQCQYPPHSQPACTKKNPCAFTCTNGFVRKGDRCVCPHPHHVCNGHCVSSACPSGSPRKRGLDIQLRMTSLCPAGKEPCNGFKGLHSYECIDITTALDSCGGCLFPLFGKSSSGRDCSTIPGVGTVKCRHSKCAVKTCIAGWTISDDGQSCSPSKN